MKQEWIIGASGSNWDTVRVYRFTGTVAETKQKLLDMVNNERCNLEPFSDWWGGTESVNDVTLTSSGLYAYGSWDDCHCDYTATPSDVVEWIN